jgi:hypothetical protein
MFEEETESCWERLMFELERELDTIETILKSKTPFCAPETEKAKRWRKTLEGFYGRLEPAYSRISNIFEEPEFVKELEVYFKTLPQLPTSSGEPILNASVWGLCHAMLYFARV